MLVSSESIIYFLILCALILGLIIRPLLSRDYSLIWSPLTVISLTYIYYIVIPSFSDLSLYGASSSSRQQLFYLAALLFLICIIIGFNLRTKGLFSNWNNLYSEKNVKWIGVMLFLIALLCYVPFRGFRYTISSEDAVRVASRTGLVSYLIDLISLFCASCGLLLIRIRLNSGKINDILVFIVILYLSLVAYIVGGFRMRIVWLIISLLTVYHLGIYTRRPKFLLILTIGVIAFLGFSIMDTTRNYGRGIDIDAASELTFNDIKSGAGENVDVTCFSIATLDFAVRSNYRVGFEPIATALLMPFPRSFFPWKPDGGYLKRTQFFVAGSADSGAAFLAFVEAFLAFGWIGVILYGLFFGWLAGIFWRNYQNNKQSIGSVLLLALFNGFCYDWISRGYMAGMFNNFIYFVIMPFWLSYILIFLRGLFGRRQS